MSRLTAWLLIAITHASIATTSSAQQSPAATRSLLINVLDRHGNPVRDLTRDKFRVRLNGKPATIVDAIYSVLPRRIVVLLDVSGSMEGSRSSKKWNIAVEAAEAVLRESPADISIALVTFSNQVHDVFDFKQNRSSMLAWFQQDLTRRPKVDLRTALKDSIVTSLKLLQPPQAGDAIYVITDGGDNLSKHSTSTTNTALSNAGVRLFAFLFAESLPTGEERLGFDDLWELTRNSGGFVFGVRGEPLNLGAVYSNDDLTYENGDRMKEGLRVFTQALNIQVNGFYTVHIAGEVPRKEIKVRLEVVDSVGKARKDVVCIYPRLMPGMK